MRRRKSEVFDFGYEVILVPIEEGIELRGILKLDKPSKEIMREIHEEEKALEERKLRLLGLL